MDLNEMKNKARELLSDLKDARQARENRSAGEPAGDQPGDRSPDVNDSVPPVTSVADGSHRADEEVTHHDDAGASPIAGSAVAPVAGKADRPVQLVSPERAESYRSRWNVVKVDFVDEPRQAVAQADSLVGELLEELEQLFRDQRRSIEHGLDKDETSTEDLRVALRHYRSFFDRLLSL